MYAQAASGDGDLVATPSVAEPTIDEAGVEQVKLRFPSLTGVPCVRYVLNGREPLISLIVSWFVPRCTVEVCANLCDAMVLPTPNTLIMCLRRGIADLHVPHGRRRRPQQLRRVLRLPSSGRLRRKPAHTPDCKGVTYGRQCVAQTRVTRTIKQVPAQCGHTLGVDTRWQSWNPTPLLWPSTIDIWNR